MSGGVSAITGIIENENKPKSNNNIVFLIIVVAS
jgi:hypothetical protein